MCECIIISCAVSLFFRENGGIFMAVIYDIAKGRLDDRRYFLEIVYDRIKTDFMRKRGTRLLPLLVIPISKAGVSTGSNQETVEWTWLL